MEKCPSCGQLGIPAEGDTRRICVYCHQSLGSCYGRLYKPGDPKCDGGIDPMSWEQKPGALNVRGPCKFAATCKMLPPLVNPPSTPRPAPAARPPEQPPSFPKPPWERGPQVAQEVMATPPATYQTVPLQAALRQAAAAPPPQVVLHQQWEHHRQAQAAQQQQQSQQQQQYYQQPHPSQAVPVLPAGYVAAGACGAPTSVPQNYVAPGVQVPAYLVAPESTEHGYMKMFGASIARAGLKAAFLQAANMFDHYPWLT